MSDDELCDRLTRKICKLTVEQKHPETVLGLIWHAFLSVGKDKVIADPTWRDANGVEVYVITLILGGEEWLITSSSRQLTVEQAWRKQLVLSLNREHMSSSASELDGVIRLVCGNARQLKREYDPRELYRFELEQLLQRDDR